MSKKLGNILVIFIILIVGSTIGFMTITDVTLIDALYMTIITISTVGFAEVVPLDNTGRIFTMFVIVGSLGTVAYTLRTMSTFFIDGELKKMWRRRMMENRIGKLDNHYILCGAGETGRSVIERFQVSNAPFVVIDHNEEKIERLQEEGVLALQGDASHEELLNSAMIENAVGLIACLSTDADNVFTVLTARQLNPNLYIVARAIERNTHAKLKKAGANNTISPNELGGIRMAALLLKPAVVAFLDVLTHVGDVVLDLEEIVVSPASTILGNTLGETRIPERTGLIVLAIQKGHDQQFKFNPGSQEILSAGDKMLVLGTTEQVAKLRSIADEN